MDQYQSPRLNCGLADWEDAEKEFGFLDDPDPTIDQSILKYFALEFNHKVKQRLFCLVS